MKRRRDPETETRRILAELRRPLRRPNVTAGIIEYPIEMTAEQRTLVEEAWRKYRRLR